MLKTLNIKTIGKIHSLGGKYEEITVLKKCSSNDYIVDYNGIKCHAIFNVFTNCYYVDDVYRRVEDN